MSLYVFFFKPSEFQLYYNCSAYLVDSIPVENRARPYLGIFSIFIGAAFQLCYLPCIFVMCKSNLRNGHCYKLMIYLSIIDVLGLSMTAICAGWFCILGMVYCSAPTLVYWATLAGLGLHYMESYVTVFLAINRCLMLYKSRIADSLFKGKRMLVWIFSPIIFSLTTLWLSPPLIYNSINAGMFLNPHLHYLPDQDYLGLPVVFSLFALVLLLLFNANMVIKYNQPAVFTTQVILWAFLLVFIYITFGVLFYIKLKKGLPSNYKSKMNKEINTFVQVFLTCLIGVLATSGFAIEQRFPNCYWLSLFGTFSLVFFQGSGAIIYLCLNKSIRKELSLAIWKKRLSLAQQHEGEWFVLFTLRSKMLRRHPGEVCFPGGMRELSDSNPIETALREANEEIGLKHESVNVVGVLKPIPSRHLILIYPVLCILREPNNIPELHVSSEVDHIFWTPLANFLSAENYKALQIEQHFRIHVFKLERPVFGITALLAIIVAMAVYDQHPSFEFEIVELDEPQNMQQDSTPRRSLVNIFKAIGKVRPLIKPDILNKKLFSKL